MPIEIIKEKELASYNIDANGLPAQIRVVDKGEYVFSYQVTIPGISEATKVILDSLRPNLITLVPIDPSRLSQKAYVEELRKRFSAAASVLIDKYLPSSDPETKQILLAYILNMMLGLGELEIPLHDDNLEEIAVNNAAEPLWVYHKKFGWCKTNLKIRSEEDIYNYASTIGRTIGRQISVLTPLMDAHLLDGSRVNATLYPISVFGNTITIRKFGKNPWTMPLVIKYNTIDSKLAALIWLCIENEISMIFAGGTASGKTSFLNAASSFIPATNRIVSLEETRELTLPDFLQWVAMVTREPNAEGKGEVTMLDLMVNALRQRPDRVIVGEIRRHEEATTLFEAIHTGHAVYATLHADNANDAIVRLTNPPINIPKIMINGIGAIVVLFRHRRKGIRRVLEFAEVLENGDVNVNYRWDIKEDKIKKVSEITRLAETLELYAGLSLKEIEEDVEEKARILDWLVKNDVTGVNEVGKIINNYYKNKEKVLYYVNNNLKFDEGILKL